MSRRALWVLFALFIVYGATIPFRFTGDPALIQAHVHRVRLNPLISPATGRRVSIPDVVQNLLLFLPFGALGMLAVPASRRSPGRVAWVTLLGAGCSAGVETLQLFTLDRITSLADVTWNTLGTLAGALGASGLALTAGALVAQARSRGLTATRAFYPAAMAVLLVCVAAWEPFDVTLDLGTVLTKAHALAGDVWQFNGLTDEGVAVLQFAVLGWAVCQWLESAGRRRVALKAGACLIAAAVGLEASQIIITSRMPGLEDALVRAAGGLAGVGLWMFARSPQPVAPWLAALALATAAATAMQQLAPFEIGASYHPVRWALFLSDYEHTTFDALSHVIELMLSYAPLGFTLAWVVPQPRRALAWTLALTLAISTPIELLQGWIVGRYPDLTDILVSLAGAALAYRLGRYARQAPITPPERIRD